jgi:hypothetical protein
LLPFQTHAAGTALKLTAQAAEAEVQKGRDKIKVLELENQELKADAEAKRALRKQVTDLKVENAALTKLHDRFKDQSRAQELKLISKADELAEKLRLQEEKAAQDAKEAEAALKSANGLAEARENRIKTLDLDLERALKSAKDAEAAFKNANELAEAREKRIQTLETDLAKALTDVEYEKAAKEEIEDAFHDNVVNLEMARESLRDNEKTLDDWRPDIYQKGYDLCRFQVLDGADVSTLPTVVEPPPGWWGDSRPCLPDRPFIDVGADTESEDSESDEEEEVPQAIIPEASLEVQPLASEVAIPPAGLPYQTPEGHVEDVAFPEDSEV